MDLRSTLCHVHSRSMVGLQANTNIDLMLDLMLDPMEASSWISAQHYVMSTRDVYILCPSLLAQTSPSWISAQHYGMSTRDVYILCPRLLAQMSTRFVIYDAYILCPRLLAHMSTRDVYILCPSLLAQFGTLSRLLAPLQLAVSFQRPHTVVAPCIRAPALSSWRLLFFRRLDGRRVGVV